MGSSKRPKRDAGRIQVPRRTGLTGGRHGANARIGTGSGGNGSKPMAAPQVCRRFGLVHTTPSARRATVGMEIWGEFDDPKVKIHSNKTGQLGDAPSQEAQFFIGERERRSGGTLTGNVLKSTEHEVRVKLCIN